MSEIARDDLALDALAAGQVPDGDDEVFGLLGALRADLEPPEPATQADATRAVPPVVPLRRKRRPLAMVALSAAAGLVLGGLATGAVVTADQPGQVFYAARKAVLGDPGQAERVTKLLDDAAEALAEGDRREARKRLEQARERLAGVEDGTQRALLTERLDRLAAIAAAAPAPRPTATPSRDDDETPEPRETEDPDDDSSGSGSDGTDDDNSGSGSSGSGSDDSLDDDSSGSGSSGSGSSGSSGSDSDSSGKGSDDVLRTLDPDKADDSGGSGGDDSD